MDGESCLQEDPKPMDTSPYQFTSFHGMRCGFIIRDAIHCDVYKTSKKVTGHYNFF